MPKKYNMEKKVIGKFANSKIICNFAIDSKSVATTHKIRLRLKILLLI